MTTKPYSQASENNKTYILPILQQAFTGVEEVLEIGSGSGQHAVFFAQAALFVYATWLASKVYAPTKERSIPKVSFSRIALELNS